MRPLSMFIVSAVLLVILTLLSACAPVDEHEEAHNFSVEIKCEQMKLMSVKAIAQLWDIDPDMLLDRIMAKYSLKGIYTTDSLLDDLRDEYAFEPREVKELAESIKGPSTGKEIEKLVSSCPRGTVNDPYPGSCGSYTDTDKDGFCDYGEPI